jgi:hypothetical protein
MGIKKMMEEAQLNYSRKTIIPASDLKCQIESIGIRKDRHTIFSLDIEAFYPLVTYGLVERTIEFFLPFPWRKTKGKNKIMPK